MASQTNPKRGHHVFNNVPKLICDSINEFFKPKILDLTKDPKRSYETFDGFYDQLNARDKRSLKPIWDDYNYWMNDKSVNGERDKIVVYENPGQTKNKAGEIVDENTARWNVAQTSVKKAVEMTLSNAIQFKPDADRLKHHFSELKFPAAANKLLESYTDTEAESVFKDKHKGTKEYKEYEEVKDALLRQVRGLPSRVEKWAEALKEYWKDHQ